MVYFLQGDVTKRIKIGKTDMPLEKRMDGLYSSDILICLGTIPDSRDDRLYHLRFHHLWSHGEWFNPGEELLQFIASLPITKDVGLKQTFLSPWDRRPWDKSKNAERVRKISETRYRQTHNEPIIKAPWYPKEFEAQL